MADRKNGLLWPETTTSAASTPAPDPADVFHGALAWFSAFEVQHAVDALDGVYLHERSFNADRNDLDPALPGVWPTAAPATEGSPATLAPALTPSPLQITLATLPDRSNVRLFAHFVWNAALVLASHIDHQRLLVRGRRVIELGAGAGIPSIVAALNGAALVVVTDFPDPPFITNLQANVERNVIDHQARSRIHVAGYAWGDEPADLLKQGPAAPPGLEAAASGAKTYEDAAAASGQFDTVLLSDVLWEPKGHRPLLESCRRIVKAAEDGGRIWLTFGLHTGVEITQAFLDLASSEEYGFDCRCVQKYRFATEWGFETTLDDHNERRRTVFTYELALPRSRRPLANPALVPVQR